MAEAEKQLWLLPGCSRSHSDVGVWKYTSACRAPFYCGPYREPVPTGALGVSLLKAFSWYVFRCWYCLKDRPDLGSKLTLWVCAVPALSCFEAGLEGNCAEGGNGMNSAALSWCFSATTDSQSRGVDWAGSSGSFEGEHVLQDFSVRPVSLSEKLHIFGLETNFLRLEGEFPKLVLVLNTSSCETTTLSVLHEIEMHIFSAHLPVIHLLGAYKADEGWIGWHHQVPKVL